MIIKLVHVPLLVFKRDWTLFFCVPFIPGFRVVKYACDDA